MIVQEDVFEARNVEAAGTWFQEQSLFFFLCFFVLPKSDVASLGQGLGETDSVFGFCRSSYRSYHMYNCIIISCITIGFN